MAAKKKKTTKTAARRRSKLPPAWDPLDPRTASRPVDAWMDEGGKTFGGVPVADYLARTNVATVSRLTTSRDPVLAKAARSELARRSARPGGRHVGAGAAEPSAATAAREKAIRDTFKI